MNDLKDFGIGSNIETNKQSRRRKVRLACGIIFTSFGRLEPEVVEKYFLEKSRTLSFNKGLVVDDYYIELRCPICGCLLSVDDRRCPYCKQRVRVKPVFPNLAKDPHFHVVTYDMEIRYTKSFKPFYSIGGETRKETFKYIEEEFRNHPEKYTPLYMKRFRESMRMGQLRVHTYFDAVLVRDAVLKCKTASDYIKKLAVDACAKCQLLPISEENRHYLKPDECVGLTEKLIFDFFRKRGAVAGNTASNIRKNNVWKKVVNSN